jgi:hypothetical protein
MTASTAAAAQNLSPSPSSASALATSLPNAVTAETLLAQHVGAPSPPLAALDQALGERNLLSSQNQQLWKLIEKQRSGYNQIMKELERVRGERDGYKARLAALGESVEKEKDREGKEKKERFALKPSASNPGMNGRETPTGRAPLVRHQSDDHGEFNPGRQCLMVLSPAIHSSNEQFVVARNGSSTSDNTRTIRRERSETRFIIEDIPHIDPCI